MDTNLKPKEILGFVENNFLMARAVHRCTKPSMKEDAPTTAAGGGWVAISMEQ